VGEPNRNSRFGGRERPQSIAKAYVRFAREQPKVFALTLMPGPNDTEDEAAHVQSWRFVLGHVACVYGEERAPEAATALWAFLQGMTALEAAGVFGERKPASSFEFGLQMWIRAASKKAHFSSPGGVSLSRVLTEPWACKAVCRRSQSSST